MDTKPAELSAIDDKSLDELLAKLKITMSKTSEQREKETRQELARHKENFACYLGNKIKKEFGERYVKNHQSEKVSIKANVDRYISETIHNAQGYYFAGIPGSGKTHILLEFYIRILENEFNSIKDDNGTLSYPLNYPDWFNRKIRYYYSSWISDLIKNREKPKVSRYNLIDDFLVEELTGYVLAGWDAYFEDINRHDGILIISSNVSPKAIDRPQYKRIASRIAGTCKIVELPTIDRREIKAPAEYSIKGKEN